MSAAAPFSFHVNKNGTATLLAYVVGNSDTPITQATISTIVYTISIIDENDPDLDTAVTNHDGATIVVASSVYDTPQTTDTRWNPADHGNKGYNFAHTIDISPNAAFAIRGRRYRIRVKFTPSSGEVFWAEWIVAVR